MPEKSEKPTVVADAGIMIPEKPTPKVDNVADPGITIPEKKAEPAAEKNNEQTAQVQAPKTTRKIDLDDDDEPAPAQQAQKAPDPKPAAPASPSTASGNVPTAKLLAEASQALAKKDLDTAASLCEKATKQDPKNARAWQMYANVTEKQGKFALAASHAEKSCNISKTANCYAYLGSLKSKSGLNDEAIEAYKKALEIDPNNAQANAKLQ